MQSLRGPLGLSSAVRVFNFANKEYAILGPAVDYSTLHNQDVNHRMKAFNYN